MTCVPRPSSPGQRAGRRKFRYAPEVSIRALYWVTRRLYITSRSRCHSTGSAADVCACKMVSEDVDKNVRLP